MAINNVDKTIIKLYIKLFIVDTITEDNNTRKKIALI